jgi:hypothetical protein
MLRIGQVETTATQDGQYTDGSVAGGVAATRLRAAAFNALQEELAHIVEEAGIELSVDDSTQVLAALRTLLLSRANPFGDIAADGPVAIATALANLGLGTAATRNVGTGANQIPDMSSFLTNIKSSPAGLYHYLPSGLLIQFGNIAASSGDVTTTFPVAFPNACLKVMATQSYSAGSGNIGYIAAAQTSKTQMVSRGSSSQLGGAYLAVGF